MLHLYIHYLRLGLFTKQLEQKQLTNMRGYFTWMKKVSLILRMDIVL